MSAQVATEKGYVCLGWEKWTMRFGLTLILTSVPILSIATRELKVKGHHVSFTAHLAPCLPIPNMSQWKNHGTRLPLLHYPHFTMRHYPKCTAPQTWRPTTCKRICTLCVVHSCKLRQCICKSRPCFCELWPSVTVGDVWSSYTAKQRAHRSVFMAGTG